MRCPGCRQPSCSLIRARLHALLGEVALRPSGLQKSGRPCPWLVQDLVAACSPPCLPRGCAEDCSLANLKFKQLMHGTARCSSSLHSCVAGLVSSTAGPELTFLCPLKEACLKSALCTLLLQVWRPEQRANTTSQGLYQKHKETPFAGTSLPGKVELTILRGQVVFNSSASSPIASQICGTTLLYRDVEKPNRGLEFYH